MNEIIDRDYYGEYERDQKRKERYEEWLDYQDRLADEDFERNNEDDISGISKYED